MGSRLLEGPRGVTGHEDQQVVTVPRWMMQECGGDPRDAMVLAQIAYWYQPPLDGSREHRSKRTVHRFDADWLVMVDQTLADQLGMTRSQVQRARTALAKRGLIETRTSKVDGERRTLVRPVIAGKRESAHRGQEAPVDDVGLCAETRDGSKREDARTRTRATPPAEDQVGDQGTSAVPDPVNPAVEVVRAAWDRRDPKPTVPFVALVKMAERFLAAGWQPQQVEDALASTQAFTDHAVEFTLNRAHRHRPSGPSPRQQRKAEATRAFVGDELPTGTVGAAFFGQKAIGR